MTTKSEVQVLLEGYIENLKYSVESEQTEVEFRNKLYNEQICDAKAKLTQATMELSNATLENEMLKSEIEFCKAQVASHAGLIALRAVISDESVSDDATDLTTAIDLVNELKTIVNGMNGF